MRVRLVSVWQAELLRETTRLVLGVVADGKQQMVKQTLRQVEQSVRLILGVINALHQNTRPVLSRDDPRVMPSGQPVSTQIVSPAQQEIELHPVITCQARVGSATLLILRYEVSDDMLLELPGEVHVVMSGTNDPACCPCILDVLQAATRLGQLASVLERSVVQPHRHTDDLVTAICQQGRGNRRVNAAAHRNDDALSVMG